jgi:hypothetical protein
MAKLLDLPQEIQQMIYQQAVISGRICYREVSYHTLCRLTCTSKTVIANLVPVVRTMDQWYNNGFRHDIHPDWKACLQWKVEKAWVLVTEGAEATKKCYCR